MEALLFILLVVILFVLLSLRSSLSQKINDLNQRLDAMSALITRIRDGQVKGTDRPAVTEEVLKPEIKSAASPSPVIQPPSPPQASERTVPEKVAVVQPVSVKPPTPPKPPEPPRPGFFERNPDLEKFIGENLANKIGIGILVLGIGFFVKYAIDQQWINVYGRVAIGLLCGAILIGVAHRLRKKFAAFSSVLVGGGIAVLYLTIAIAFHEYQILGQTVAFAIMVAITAFTIVLSLAYNRVELAILAILGGFGSPFMVSNGQGNYVVLFSYILLLDAGMLILAYFRKWHLVNLVAYAFTVILFGGWLGARFDETSRMMVVGAMVFATSFYFIFFAMNVINNLKLRRPFKGLDFGLLLSNTFFYYAAGMVILSNPYGEVLKGLFTALLAVFNCVFAFSLYRRANVDRNLVFLLIGLVLTFISLAAPVQLEGNYITLFWAAEAVLLLWLSQKSGIRLMKIGSVIVMVLMWISLVMDWSIVYYDRIYDENYTLNILLNKGYITGLVALCSVLLFNKLLRREVILEPRYTALARPILLVAAGVIFYVSHLLELTFHLNVYVSDYAARTVIIGVFNMFCVLLLIALEGKITMPDNIRSALAFLGVFAVLSYLLVYHEFVVLTRNFFMSGQRSSLGFLFHYILVAELVLIIAWSLMRFRAWIEFNTRTHHLYSWFFVFGLIFLASAELDHSVLLTSGVTGDATHSVIHQNHKIGYPILWGVASFILIAVGLRKKRRHLRIISLTLLLITLVKLFLFDIKGISEGGKIAAFISLGLLLLIVSFMYQRLKRILLSDDQKQNENVV